MSASYISAIKEALPKVAIVFDRFHIMKLANKMLDKIRMQEYHRLPEEERQFIKGSRFVLLKNYENLSEEEADQVNALMKVNSRLFQAYAMKEQLRTFWEKPDWKEGGRFLANWIGGAKLTNIRPLISFAKTLERNFIGLINYFEHKITNGFAEGINNKIKTLKRQAYGYRDMHYFKLRLYHLHAQKYALAG